MKRRAKTESGFTLLELLISLALVAVLLSICLLGVRLAISSRETGTYKIDIQQRLRVLNERLNSTLRSANLIFIPPDSKSLLPSDEKEKTDEPGILAFEGKPESLKFVTFSEKLLGGKNSPWMHEIRFYLQKNKATGLLEILMNERDFSPKGFLAKEGPGTEEGQTLRIVQDVAYLKFRYYYEISEEGPARRISTNKAVKYSGQWTDKYTTETIDFKSDMGKDRITGKNEFSIPLPRAVEVSVGFWEVSPLKEGQERRRMVIMPPFTIPIQVGMVFERYEEGVEDDLDQY
jgi:prepilin-type N-terminal cleavage/methylation domain-containing protein